MRVNVCMGLKLCCAGVEAGQQPGGEGDGAAQVGLRRLPAGHDAVPVHGTHHPGVPPPALRGVFRREACMFVYVCML